MQVVEKTRLRLLAGSREASIRYGGFLVALLVIGLWLRLRNLGDLAFFVDEGVEALAIRSILDDGIPDVDSGLVYLRFPLYLYVQAAFTALFGFTEFWFRFPSALFGVAAIYPTYLLGKELFNRPVGALSAAMIALSSWEIELSRYGRPYIAVQFFFVLALLFLYRGFILDRTRYKLAYLAAAVGAFLVHDLGQVVVVLLIIPLIYPGHSVRKRLSFIPWTLGTGILLLIVQKMTGFGLPDGVVHASDRLQPSHHFLDRLMTTVGLPRLHLPDMSHLVVLLQSQKPFALALAVAGIIGLAYAAAVAVRRKQPGRAAIVAVMLASAIVYQFGLVAISLVLYLGIYARGRTIFRDRILVAGVVTSAVLLFLWVGAFLTAGRVSPVQIPLALFSFPDVYKYLLRWILKGWPVLSVGMVVGSLWFFVRLIQSRLDSVALTLLGALYIPAVFSSLFKSFFVPSYTLHLFPVMFLMTAAVLWSLMGYIHGRFNIVKFSRSAMFAGASLVLFVIAPDLNPASAWSATERTYTTEKHPIRNTFTFRIYSDFHQDTQSPAEYVKTHRSPGDVVMAIGMDHATQLYHFYSGGIEYAATSPEEAIDFGLIRGDSIFHYITGYQFITSKEKLLEIIDAHRGRLWILGDTRVLRRGYPLESAEPIKDVIRDLAEHPDFTGRDGITFALKVE